MRLPSQKVRLVSTALHGYAGRLVYAGQEFDADERDVKYLLAEGLARERTRPAIKLPAKAEAATPEAAAEQPRSKRIYRRRDLEAEQS